ncbi:MAG: hypothetical protein HY819_05350 [Acidobacteria bacterium]|nr:hypothetical protein [Acidobacteriota bacterium]
MKKLRNLLIFAFITIVLALIIKAQSANDTRPLAADFPRGALVFAQVNDLPKMLQSWNESKLKEQYLSSNNYEQFLNRHLATKLIERVNEFGVALGFDFNDRFFQELSNQQSAIALYDIGRIEFVFIAPLDKEKYLLSQLVTLESELEEIELKPGVSYFAKTLEVDRGRQKQLLTFALLDGKFILANNEQLMIRTLNNVTAKVNSQTTDRLNADPNYQALIKKIKPHYATIWVAQEKLNQDWYFRNYWIMNNITDLRNIRAAIFDIELQDKEWREERYFLTKSNLTTNQISALETQNLYKLVPQNLPYFKIEAITSAEQISKLIHNYMFDNDIEPKKGDNSRSNYRSYYVNTDDTYESYYDSYYLYGSNYEKEINDPIDADDLEVTPENSYYNRQTALDNLREIFSTSQAKALVKMQKPKAIEGALFAEFHKAFVINLANPTQFDSLAFEKAIARLAADSTMIAGNSASLSWKDSQDKRSRVLVMPMLGWQLSYTLKNNNLIFSNNSSLLKEISSNIAKAKKHSAITSKALTNLTVINFSNREQTFDNIFNKIQSSSINSYRQTHANGETQDFFVNNIASLLDTISAVETITITRDSSSNYLHELICLKLRDDN